MKHKLFFLLVPGFLFRLMACSQPTDVPDTLLLFYLGGQSNMDGYGLNSDLPSFLNKEFNDVWIFHGNASGDDIAGGGLGLWEALKPGHGWEFSSDGTVNSLGKEFGIELSFAARLQELLPGKKIALIKYSRGGTSIDSMAAGGFGCWDPDYQGQTGINQYDNFLATIRNAIAVNDIDGDGRADFLLPCGIIWMQGESDAFWTEEIASRYYGHLKRLMDLMRAAFLTDDLPVVIGKISESGQDEEDGRIWAYGELVQAAQEKFARTDGHAVIVRSTLGYGYCDPYHYNSEGYIDLGRKFAEAVVSFRISQ